MDGGGNNRNIRNLEDVRGGPQEWFQSLPILTRYWFGLAITTTLAVNLGTVGIERIVFLWEPLKNNFEVWRLVTPFLYMGDFGLHMLFGFYFLVEYSKRYETGSGFNTGAGGGTADYAFCLLFGVVVMLLSYPLLTAYLMPIFSRNLTYYVLYVWTKLYPTLQVSIWGFPIPAIYLPFALAGLSLCMGNPISDIVHGSAVGHLYYFLADVVPLVYHKEVLHTPQFLIDQFGVGVYRPEPPTAAAAPQPSVGGFRAPGRVNPPGDLRQRRTTGGGYNWGEGRTLGNS